MAVSQSPKASSKTNQLKGLGKGYQGAAIRWRDFPSSITSAGGAAYQEIVITCGFRLFIMGVEVTPHVMGSVSVDKHGRDGKNSISFTLDNNFSKFIYTNWNLGGDIELDSQYYGNLVKSSGKVNLSNMVQVLDAKVSSQTKMEAIPDASKLNWYVPDYSGKDKFVFDEVPKRDLFSYKSKLGIRTSATGGTYKSRYDLTPGACAINIFDHVRYFILDPNEDSLIIENTKWKPEYTGFVTSVSVSENPVTGESSISITCHDIRHVMQKMRYMTNTNDASVLSTLISFTSQDEVQDGAGLFNDLFIAAGNPTWSTTLSDCSADTVIRAITLGEDIAALTADKGRENRVAEIERAQDKLYPSSADMVPATKLEEWYTQKLKAVQAKKKAAKSSTFSPVGTFSMGLYKGYDPPGEGADNSEQVAKLEEWMDLLNFGIGRQWMDYDTVTMIGQFTRPSMGNELGATDDQSPFSAFNGFVHILCPSGGLSVSNIWDRVFITFDGSPTMSNRMEVLEHMCNTIDYQIQVNTMGDLAFEFPMYDFYPEEFGKYKYTMALSDSLKHHEFNDEGDGNPVTGFRVFGQYKSEDSLSEDNSWLQQNLYSVYIKSDFMASKYGVLVEEYPIPWAMNAWGTGTVGQQTGEQVPPSDNKEKMSALASFGIIEFTKRIAKMSSMSLNSVYCPFLWPNKPMLNRDIRRMGIMNSVNSSVQVNGVCTTGIGCEYIRKADTDGSFLNICGAKNTPFSYASRSGLALFPNKAAIVGDKELVFKQNGDIIYTLDNGFGIEIVMPDELSMQRLFEKFGVNNTPASVEASANGPVKKTKWSDVQQVYNRFKTLPQAEQDKMNAIANKICGGDGSLRGWQIFQYAGTESNYKANIPNAQFGAIGATGLIQFMPATLRGMGIPGCPQVGRLNKRGGWVLSDAEKATINNWFRSSPYCVGPNATLNQLELVDQYLTSVAKKNGGIKSLSDLNRAVFLPGANKDPDMSFHDPRQKWSSDYADKISAGNGGADSLGQMMRMKGLSTAPPPSDAQLEANRLATSSGSTTASAVQKAAPPTLRTSTAATSSLYVAGVPRSAQKPATSRNFIDNLISSAADPIGDALGSGINSGVNGYMNDKVSQTGVDQAVTSVSKITSSAVSSTTQSTLEQADSAASNVSVFGYRAMKGGLGLSKPVASSTDTPRAGVTIGR